MHRIGQVLSLIVFPPLVAFPTIPRLADLGRGHGWRLETQGRTHGPLSHHHLILTVKSEWPISSDHHIPMVGVGPTNQTSKDPS